MATLLRQAVAAAGLGRLFLEDELAAENPQLNEFTPRGTCFYENSLGAQALLRWMVVGPLAFGSLSPMWAKASRRKRGHRASDRGQGYLTEVLARD